MHIYPSPSTSPPETQMIDFYMKMKGFFHFLNESMYCSYCKSVPLLLFVMNWKRCSSAATETLMFVLYRCLEKFYVQMPVPWLERKTSTMGRKREDGRNPLWHARTKPLQHKTHLQTRSNTSPRPLPRYKSALTTPWCCIMHTLNSLLCLYQ